MILKINKTIIKQTDKGRAIIEIATISEIVKKHNITDKKQISIRELDDSRYVYVKLPDSDKYKIYKLR